MPRFFKSWLCLSVAAGLAAGSLPVQASEVVKLARLVVSGKRSQIEPPRSSPADTRPSQAPAQVHGSGGTDEAGTAPAPTRGVS